MTVQCHHVCVHVADVAVTLGALNGMSAVAATRINFLFTIAKTLALAMIIIAGIVKMGQGRCDTIKLIYVHVHVCT